MTQVVEEHAPRSTAPAALEVLAVSGGYGATTVLRDVSLRVPAGGITALLGPNGAGKTTLLRMVSGLLPVARGTVKIHGADVTRTKPHRRFEHGLCHVPEGRGVFRNLTVRDNLVMMASAGKEADAIERAADVFPILGERINQGAGTLSGGEQQMLALAVAYIRDPTLVLVDEASLGLAPIVVERIFEFLESLRERGVALLIVDQFVHRALRLATVAYILNRGTIAYEGSPAELLETNLFEQYLGRGPA
jgi:branched-chain amino acid transport system ATP-binding protein